MGASLTNTKLPIYPLWFASCNSLQLNKAKAHTTRLTMTDIVPMTEEQLKGYIDSIKEAIADGLSLDIEVNWRYMRHGAVDAGPWTHWHGYTWTELDGGEIMVVFVEGQDPNTPSKTTLTYFPQRRVEYGTVRLKPAPVTRMKSKTIDAEPPTTKGPRTETTAQVHAMSVLTSAFESMADNLKGEGDKVALAPNFKVPATIGELLAPLYPQLWLGRHEAWKSALSDFLMRHGVALEGPTLVEFTRGREELAVWLETAKTPTTKRAWSLPFLLVFRLIGLTVQQLGGDAEYTMSTLFRAFESGFVDFAKTKIPTKTAAPKSGAVPPPFPAPKNGHSFRPRK